MLRYLNMFILIGAALIGISIAGFATGNRFLAEAGQTPSPFASLIYLGAGVLMIVNGIVSVRTAPAEHPHQKPIETPKSDAPAKEWTEPADKTKTTVRS